MYDHYYSACIYITFSWVIKWWEFPKHDRSFCLASDLDSLSRFNMLWDLDQQDEMFDYGQSRGYFPPSALQILYYKKISRRKVYYFLNITNLSIFLSDLDLKWAGGPNNFAWISFLLRLLIRIVCCSLNQKRVSTLFHWWNISLHNAQSTHPMGEKLQPSFQFLSLSCHINWNELEEYQGSNCHAC